MDSFNGGSSSAGCSEQKINIGYGADTLARQQNLPRSDIELYGNSAASYNKDDNMKITPIKAHKNILASASPYLRDAFCSKDFLEFGAKKHYKIDQIDHETLRLVVACIYQRKVYVPVSEKEEDEGDFFDVAFERVENVLEAADFLLIPILVQACGRALDHLQYLDAPISTWMFAKQYHCDVLATAAARAAANDLYEAAEWQLLDLSPEMLIELVKDLVAVSVPADSLCDAVVKWFHADESARKKWCNEIMRHVPFQRMSSKGLLRVLRIWQCCSENFVSADVALKVEQMQELRARLDKVERSLKGILGDYECLRNDWIDHGHEPFDSDAEYDDEYDYKLDDTCGNSDDEDKMLAARRTGRLVVAHRFVD